jgi:hypothetical protein
MSWQIRMCLRDSLLVSRSPARYMLVLQLLLCQEEGLQGVHRRLRRNEHG